MNTAVLFIVFNRPETTAKVFEAIRCAAPTRLYVAADGSREGDKEENERCKQVREIATNVDWDCEIKTLFSDHNLGCKHGCVSAIDWFFENEEMGIILEDDVLPDHTFFQFCEELLIKYYDDSKVMHINGTNFSKNYSDSKNSYFFSKLPIIWGWASWRRTWEKYDSEIASWRYVNKNEIFKKNNFNYIVKSFWSRNFDSVYNNKKDTWCHQYDYFIWSSQGSSVTPSKNLINNIGFGEHATHTVESLGSGSNMESFEMEFPLVHPLKENIDMKYDNELFRDHYKCNFFYYALYIIYDYFPIIKMIKQKIKNSINLK